MPEPGTPNWLDYILPGGGLWNEGGAGYVPPSAPLYPLMGFLREGPGNRPNIYDTVNPPPIVPTLRDAGLGFKAPGLASPPRDPRRYGAPPPPTPTSTPTPPRTGYRIMTKWRDVATPTPPRKDYITKSRLVVGKRATHPMRKPITRVRKPITRVRKPVDRRGGPSRE